MTATAFCRGTRFGGQPGRCQQRSDRSNGPAQQALLAKALTTSKDSGPISTTSSLLELVIRWRPDRTLDSLSKNELGSIAGD